MMYYRPRIKRKSAVIRNLVSETRVDARDFLCPLFIVEGSNVKEEIPSMPNYFRYSLDRIQEQIDTYLSYGLKAFLLFVKVRDELKDNTGQEAWNPDGLMQKSIRTIKERYPEVLLMSDVALDPYSSYGHDGIVKEEEIVNDETVEALVKMALSHVESGVDWVAPSDMMDGRIGSIREAFEGAGYKAGIMSYTAKYASAFYGPFRDALDSAPGFGDKKSYQMDPANSNEALHEAELDMAEGADMLMVKPAMPYLDIIARLKAHSAFPISAYQVSGEYAMIKAAASKGWLNEQEIILESITSIKRAGTDLIASYFALDFVRIQKELYGS
jgi:porphobilinogen synthase